MKLLLIAVILLTSCSQIKEIGSFYDSPEELALAVLDAYKKDEPDDFYKIIPTEKEFKDSLYEAKGQKQLRYHNIMLSNLKSRKDLEYLKNRYFLYPKSKIDEYDIKKLDKRNLERFNLFKHLMQKDFKPEKIKIRNHKGFYETASVYLYIKGHWALCINGCTKTKKGWCFFGLVDFEIWYGNWG